MSFPFPLDLRLGVVEDAAGNYLYRVAIYRDNRYVEEGLHASLDGALEDMGRLARQNLCREQSFFARSSE